MIISNRSRALDLLHLPLVNREARQRGVVLGDHRLRRIQLVSRMLAPDTGAVTLNVVEVFSKTSYCTFEPNRRYSQTRTFAS